MVVDICFDVGPAMLASTKGMVLAERPREEVLTETTGPVTSLDGTVSMTWSVDPAVESLVRLWGVGALAAQA